MSPPAVTVISMSPAELEELVERAAEKGAARAQAKREADGLLASEQTALILGYRRPDGTAHLPNFKGFRRRHPDFDAMATRIGQRLHWRRSLIEIWIAQHGKR